MVADWDAAVFGDAATVAADEDYLELRIEREWEDLADSLRRPISPSPKSGVPGRSPAAHGRSSRRPSPTPVEPYEALTSDSPAPGR